MVRCSVLTAVVATVTVVSGLAACGGTDDPGVAPSTAGSSSSTTGTPTTDASTTGASTTDSSTGSSSSTPAGSSPEAERVEFDELLADLEELVGTDVVVVTGTVFFTASCPPPSSVVQPCVLTARLAAPGSDVPPIDLDDTIPLGVAGRLISCAEGGDAPVGACEGWARDAEYELTATVRRLPVGDRETGDVYLDVMARTER